MSRNCAVLAASILSATAALIFSADFSTAFGATLDQIQGRISINRGDGFKPVTASMEVLPGDEIMADASASAKVIYEGGCVVSVERGSVVFVQQTPPCEAAATPRRRPYLIGAAVAGLIAGGVALGIGASGSDNESVSGGTPDP